MIHFSCDACGCLVDDERYSVTINVSAQFDPEALTEADLDSDHLAEIAAELESQLLTGDIDAPAEEPRHQTMQFDLCPACRRRFVADPVGRGDAKRRLDFSKN